MKELYTVVSIEGINENDCIKIEKVKAIRFYNNNIIIEADVLILNAMWEA